MPHIKDVVDRFAAEGFVALAPDLYHGETTTEPDEAGKLMMALNLERAAKDLSGAVDYLLGLDAVHLRGLGVIGFCMGGGLALAARRARPDAIKAAAPFYGVIPWPSLPARSRQLQARARALRRARRRSSGPTWSASSRSSCGRWARTRRSRPFTTVRPRVLQRHAARGLPARACRGSVGPDDRVVPRRRSGSTDRDHRSRRSRRRATSSSACARSSRRRPGRRVLRAPRAATAGRGRARPAARARWRPTRPRSSPTSIGARATSTPNRRRWLRGAGRGPRHDGPEARRRARSRYVDEVEACYGVRPRARPRGRVRQRATSRLDDVLPGDGPARARRYERVA